MPLDARSPDGMLIAAVLAGEREAFAHLVTRYQGPLFKAAISRLGQRALAEDVVQETFLCALKWLASYNSKYSFRTWLWTILLNQCSRQGQREARHMAAGVFKCETDATSATSSPLEALLAREDGRLVHELLARLPQAQADALRLRFFGGLTFPEIAAAMECSEPGAKHRVKAGLLTLAKWVTDPCIAATSGRAEPHDMIEPHNATNGRGYANGE
ncbi:MAG: RNA polymerase sigma factor [Planctomycetaceae bacterium]|nr:RNA polymerase sigma factor [Planctomycetaceae bacterium]